MKEIQRLILLVKDSRRTPFLLLIVFVYCPPVLLLWIGIIPFRHHFTVLVLFTLLIAILAVIRRYTMRDLGFRKDTLRNSLVWNSLLTIVLAGILYVAFYFHWIREPTIPNWSFFFLFYYFVSSPSQEFLYRSVVFAEMQRAGIESRFWKVAFSSINYSFMHVIYNDMLTLVATLVVGVMWGFIYEKYPNYWGVAFSHAALGTVAILVGLV